MDRRADVFRDMAVYCHGVPGGRPVRAPVALARDADALEAWRVEYLGRKGALGDAMKVLGVLARDERPAYGQAVN